MRLTLPVDSLGIDEDYQGEYMRYDEYSGEREEKSVNKRKKIFLIFFFVNIILSVSLFASLYWAFDVSLEHSIIWSVSLLILLFLICFMIIYFITFFSSHMRLNKKIYKKYKKSENRDVLFENHKYKKILDKLYKIDELVKDVRKIDNSKYAEEYIDFGERLKKYAFKYYKKYNTDEVIDNGIREIADFIKKINKYRGNDGAPSRNKCNPSGQKLSYSQRRQ